MPYWLDRYIDNRLYKKYDIDKYSVRYSRSDTIKRAYMREERLRIDLVYDIIRKILTFMFLCATFEIWFPLLVITWMPLAIHIHIL
jgi:hypothetical protein